jgi:hypothetical protein
MTEPKVVKEEVKKASGGSEIEVKTSIVEIPKAEEGGGEVKEEGLPRAESEEVGAVNEALIETVVRVLGKTLALVTKIPEVDFDESETEQLKNLWSPFVPNINPLAMAIIGTVVITGGKIGVYMSKRPKPIKKAVETGETKKVVDSIESQLEKEWKP